MAVPVICTFDGMVGDAGMGGLAGLAGLGGMEGLAGESSAGCHQCSLQTLLELVLHSCCGITYTWHAT